MSEREYPRWVNHLSDPKLSVVAEDAESEAAILAAWGFDGPEHRASVDAPMAVEPLAPIDKLVPPTRYDLQSLEGARDGEIGGYQSAESPEGEWVKWEDVSRFFSPAVPVEANPLVQNTAPPKRSGWPKGKPRAPRAAVN